MNETYIRMCREAVELQEAWEPKPGDLIYNPYPSIHADYNVDILVNVKKTPSSNFHESEFEIKRILLKEDDLSFHGTSKVESEMDIKTRFKWLPRQEDLQEIHNTTPALIKKFVDSNYLFFHDQQEHGFEDWDLIWLCYVMYIVYDKTWNGTTWGAIL